jgi:hypothetical protein
VAALALVFLIFAVTSLYLGRIAGAYSQIIMRHGRTSALFLADAGVQKAAMRLLDDPDYSGEQGTKLATGRFDVKVTREGSAYIITSTGFADSPFKRKPKMTVQASVRLEGNGFRIMKWRENP